MMMQDKHPFVIGKHRYLSAPGRKTRISDHEAQGHAEKTISLSRKIRGRCQRHWRRFWCLYAVVSIVFLAIFLPVFFLVAVPAIAQRIVDDTALPVYSAEILDPKPGEVSFSLHTSLKVPTGLSIHTDSLNLSLFDREVRPIEPYLTVKLPAYDLKGKTDLIVTQNNTAILSQSKFVDTLKTAVYKKRFTLSAKGSTVGHLGALKAPLTLEKDIELDGLDKLRGFSIQSAQLLLPKEDDGTNIIGTANLPNYSVFTFELGNVTLNLKSSDLIIGWATIQNVLLRPGDNNVSLRGTLDVTTILDNLDSIMELQKDALKDGEIELSASGNSTVYNAIHIEYYEQILNDLTLTARVSILGILGDTLQGLLENRNSTLGNTLRNMSSIIGDLSETNNISSAAHALRALA